MDVIITILPVVTKDLPINPRFTPYDFLSRCKFSTLPTRQPIVELSIQSCKSCKSCNHHITGRDIVRSNITSADHTKAKNAPLPTAIAIAEFFRLFKEWRPHDCTQVTSVKSHCHCHCQDRANPRQGKLYIYKICSNIDYNTLRI